MSDYTYVQADAAYEFVKTIFRKVGIPDEHASDAADVLLYASRRGVDTHGLKNLKSHYVEYLENGKIRKNPTFQIEYETPISARVNGDGGLGLAAGCWGMRLALEKAQASGMGFVSMRNSHHFGAAGYYPWMALEHDMIGIGLTGRFSATGKLVAVAPTFSARPLFSTNPIAISFPTDREPPYVFDMATSVVPFNRIYKHRDSNEPVPIGWGIDAKGNPTTDPHQIRSVFPLGGTREMGSHKGTGLAMVVEVLCSVLSGGWGVSLEHDGETVTHYRQHGDGHFFGAIRIDLFSPVDEFKRGMDAMIQEIHAAPPEPGQDRIYVAGEIEHETEQERVRDGIPLPDTIVADFVALSKEYGVVLPF